jgi:signal transduction histidine kinase
VSKRSVAFDVVVALASFATGQAEAWNGAFSTHRQGPHWAQAVAYGIASLALLVRRHRPLACVAVVCGALAAEYLLVGAPEGMGVLVTPLIAAYSVANREDRPTALRGLGMVAGLGAVWVTRDPVTVDLRSSVQAAVWTSPWIIAWLLGAYLRARRLYIQGLVREREERAQSAVAEERNRIARELHDVIGHSVSVMTVQASAVRRLMRQDQAKERAALETVEATGRAALTEMRRMVGVLRDANSAPDLQPPPTLDQLDRLIEGCRRAGLVVELRCEGDRVPLAAGLDLTAYRLVQEALTNTLRHARASRADVVLTYSGDSLAVRVTDDGAGPAPNAEAGNGLLGMRERVNVYGGDLRVGPGPHGGFEVVADLPLGER